MSPLSNRIQQAHQLLTELLGAQLAEIIKMIEAEPGSPGSFIIDMPDANDIDLDIGTLNSLVARTSNNYGRIARYCGIARAELKLAEGKYKRSYKSSRFGKNDAEREANAIASSEEEMIALNVIEAIVELIDKAEAHARIASETARKLLDKSAVMRTANAREAKGFVLDKDFY